MLPLSRPGFRLFLALSLILAALTLVACGSTNHNHMEDMENMDGADHEHIDHAAQDRIANDGATIRITAPANGATFTTDDDIVVAVAIEGFTLNEDGSHWHVYVDGASWGMVMGGNLDQVLRGMAPGEHLIEVYLAGGDHVELQDGDSISITVQE